MSFSRRQILKIGALGGALSLGNFLRLNAAEGQSDSGRSAILVFLGGGPSHQDTFDGSQTIVIPVSNEHGHL